MSTARDLSTLIDPATAGLPGALPINGIIYGPIQTRRMGLSLGINILGSSGKVCSFDCPYCDLGTTSMRLNKVKKDVTFPTPEEVFTVASETFKRVYDNGPAINSICISGNGEPTLHPEFLEVVQAIVSARDMWLADKPISILTNGSTLDTRKVTEGMNRLDERIVKIDAGNEKIFKALNAPLSRTTLSRILAGTRSLKDVIVQSLFVQGLIDNTHTSDIDDWIEAVALIKPKQVQIHTISRQPAVAGVLKCDEDTLYTIASRLERKLQIKALVTP